MADSDGFTTDMYSALRADAGGKGDKNPENHDVESVRSKITDAKALRKTAKWDDRWSDFINIYSNKYPYEELSEYDDVVVPNMVFSTVNVIVPSVAINNPTIDIEANQAEDEGPARVVRAVVNHQWNVFNVQEEVRAAVKDSTLIGHGWAKVTWATTEKDVAYTKEELQQLIAMALQEKDAAIAADPASEDRFPSDQEIIDSVPASRMKRVKDQPDVNRVSPFDMFVDPDAKRLVDARWIAQRSFVPIKTAKANKDWNAKARKSLVKVNLSKAREAVKVENQNEQSSQDGFVEVWEFYDLVDGTMCTFAEGCKEFLSEPVESPFMYGHPFAYLANYEVPERFYPVGDVETIFPLQLELAIARTAQINDRKRGRRITLFREAALGSQGVEDLRDGKDNVMIPVLQKDTPFSEVFQQISSQGLQPEWYQADQKAMEDINLVSGVSEYARGGTADIRRTATEVGVSQDYANARSSDKLAKVERFMNEIAERMIRLSQEFMDGEDVAKVVTDGTVQDWVPYDREALQGDFTFKVRAGSSQPQNESFRLQQAARMMEQFAPLIGSGFLNDQEFLAEVMRLSGWEDTQRFIGPGPPPPMPEEQGAPMPEQQGMPQGMQPPPMM